MRATGRCEPRCIWEPQSLGTCTARDLLVTSNAVGCHSSCEGPGQSELVSPNIPDRRSRKINALPERLAGCTKFAGFKALDLRHTRDPTAIDGLQMKRKDSRAASVSAKASSRAAIMCGRLLPITLTNSAPRSRSSHYLHKSGRPFAASSEASMAARSHDSEGRMTGL